MLTFKSREDVLKQVIISTFLVNHVTLQNSRKGDFINCKLQPINCTYSALYSLYWLQRYMDLNLHSHFMGFCLNKHCRVASQTVRACVLGHCSYCRQTLLSISRATQPSKLWVWVCLCLQYSSKMFLKINLIFLCICQAIFLRSVPSIMSCPDKDITIAAPNSTNREPQKSQGNWLCGCLI